MSADGVTGLESRLRETAALLAVARVASATTDFSEALRLICRELAKLTGAETVAAYVRQSEGAELSPVAAYRVPKPALEVLAIRTEWETRITRKKLAVSYGVPVRTIDNVLDRRDEYFRSVKPRRTQGTPALTDSDLK